jgi:hypothetical protein
VRDWDFWMWLAYGGFAIAATIIAADQSIKSADALKQAFSWLITKPIWAFSPLLLIIAAAALLLLHDFGFVGSKNSKDRSASFIKWDDPYKPLRIVGKTFRNQEVELDGAAYSECKFCNVTFKYNGTTPIQFDHNSINGQIWFKSDNPSVNGTFVLLKGFKVLGDGVTVIVPPGANIDGAIVEP